MPTKAAISLWGKRQAIMLTATRGLWILAVAGWLSASLILIGVEQTRFLLIREKALNYREGDLVAEDFHLDRDFSFIDAEATKRVVELSRSLMPPVYFVRHEITDSVLGRYNRFVSLLGASISERPFEADMAALEVEFPGAANVVESWTSRSETERLLSTAEDILQSVQAGGIFKIGEGASASGVIEALYNETLPERRVTLSRDELTVPENLQERVRAIEALESLAPSNVEFVVAVVSYFAEPNGYLNAELTEKSRDDAEKAIEPIQVSYPKGTRLLEAGTVVSGQQYRALEALRGQRAYHDFIKPLLYTVFIFALGLIVARIFNISLGNAKTRWLFIALSGIYLLLSSVLIALIEFQSEISVIMPTALFTLLLAQLLQDRRVAILTSILMGLLIFFLTSNGGYDFLITMSAGIAGALAVGKKESRMGLLKAGPRLAIAMATTIFLAGLLFGKPMKAVLITSAYSALNGLLTGILSLAFLPLLEHLLNTATTFRLIELSDQNVPILKRMRIRAPGTYIHSQNVAHLAEAACDAIGANGLLARVGAYYHDIGKIDQPEFFVENQTGENRHDDLKATLSVTVIKSHVKIGMEKGRELRLPDEVLAVIEQHHGTSVIKYFYDRALNAEGNVEASPNDFSYEGPKPISREAAVVMLADNAEAATRASKRLTLAKLEKYVWDLIMERFRTGELNECELTLRELEIIKKTFVSVLTGHFHTRIEYPKASGI